MLMLCFELDMGPGGDDERTVELERVCLATEFLEVLSNLAFFELVVLDFSETDGSDVDGLTVLIGWSGSILRLGQ